MTICMAYEMNAMTSPTCISPAETEWAPNQTMTTVMAFMRNIMSGIMSAMAWLVKSCVAMRSDEASSKRRSSWSSRQKALMGRSPSSISRATRLTRSTSRCIWRNLGMVKKKSTAITPMSARTAAMIVHSRPEWTDATFTMATTPMTGASMTMRMNMTRVIWTCCTSLVHRVMRLACEKRPTSAGEKSITCSKRSWRVSRAMAAPVRAATRPQPTAASRPTRQNASIVPAVLIR